MNKIRIVEKKIKNLEIGLEIENNRYLEIIPFIDVKKRIKIKKGGIN